MLVLSLAVSDFFVGVIIEPCNCVSKFAELKRNVPLLCLSGQVALYSLWILSLMSLITLTAITVDRYLVARLHIRYNSIITVKRYVIVYGTIWNIIVTLGTLKIFLRSLNFMAVVGTLYPTLFVTNVCLIYKIHRVIRRHTAQIQEQENAVQTNTLRPKFKKSVSVMLTIIAAFLLCYIPFFVIMVVNHLIRESTLVKGYSMDITNTMVMFNSLLNPVIYCWRIEEFRCAAYKLFSKLRKSS